MILRVAEVDMGGGDFSFDAAFKALTGNDRPLSWQRRLFAEHFAAFDPDLPGKDTLPHALDIPTGLGKTSVMAIWLLARAHPDEAVRRKIPRRLVYVVDRRAVVDQATVEAVKLRDNLEAALDIKERLGLGEKNKLPISTLRGQYVDNQNWLADPAAPAIIVGTVDMIGSRLLFSGYGVSTKMRPFHAGFLGADTLVVLDEAHLVPPFEALLEEIESKAENHKLVPPFKVLSLSATGKDRQGSTFRLRDADVDGPIVEKRVTARKRLKLEPPLTASELAKMLASRAWDRGIGGRRVIVFCNNRKTAQAVYDTLVKRLKERLREASGKPDDAIQLIVGARRVHEREELARSIVFKRFSPRTAAEEQAKAGDLPGFLVCTSAGEVGVDLDADHMVCDLVAWERMVQRLGRVNRLGTFCIDESLADSLIDVFPVLSDKDKESEVTVDEERISAWRMPFESELWLAGDDGRRDASSGALLRLRENEEFRGLTARAMTPAPLRPALTRALADAWSMTSLDEHTGRPDDIQPWLRGWEVDAQPQTQIVWRKHLPVRRGGGRELPEEINEFFESAPLHTSEVLETETWRVVDWLLKRAPSMLRAQIAVARDDEKETVGDRTVLLVSNGKNKLGQGQERWVQWSLGKLAGLGETDNKGNKKENKKERERFEAGLQGCRIVVDALLGGLDRAGMLTDDIEDDRPPTIDTDAVDTTDVIGAERRWPARPFALCATAQAKPPEVTNWKFLHQFALEKDDDGNVSRWLVVYEPVEQNVNEDGRALSTRKQTLADHQGDVVRCVRKTAEKIGLPPEYVSALVIAARLHDEGKRLWRWQRAFSAPRDGVYAKTKGPLNTRLLDGYRHELTSLWKVEDDPEFRRLDPKMQDLVLHLVAAHHGYARPVISPRNCEESGAEQKAREVALRFARLQRCWGPWGLAWWESLLRAADQQASRANDEQGEVVAEAGSAPGTTGEAA